MSTTPSDTMTPEFHGWTRCPDCGEYTDYPHDHDPVWITSNHGPISKHTIVCTIHDIRQDFTDYREADKYAHAHRDESH